MKKTLRTSLAALLLLCSFVACSSDDKDEVDQSIQLGSDQQLNQNVYADDEKGTSVVSFTTKGAWVSTIEDNKVKAAADGTSQTDWVSITPDRGNKADNYEVAINLKPNYTGAKRSAKIIINCDGDKVEINVTQDAVTQDGKLPEGKDDDYELGFLLLDYDYRLLFTDEAGKELKMITTLEDSCTLSLSNYNKDTKEAYIYRYYSDTVSPINEFIAINIETKEQKTLVANFPAFDRAKISTDGKFIVYDKAYKKEGYRSEIVKRSLTDGKEVVIYNSPSDDISVESINKDGSIVVLTQDNKVIVTEGNIVKYTFTEGDDDYVNALLSPNEDKLILQYGISGVKLCNLDGSNREIIQSDKQPGNDYIEGILWSIDGKYIYIDDYAKPNEVWKMDVAEKKIESITNSFPIRYLYEGVLSVKITK